jgi:photosystem II stability/assembly factor-like uncharacterized protein
MHQRILYAVFLTYFTSTVVDAQTFVKVECKNHLNFYKGVFLDNGNGWSIEEPPQSGFIYHTSDCGITWHAQTDLEPNDIFFNMTFIDDKHGWVVGRCRDTTLFFLQRTVNGGDSWEKITIKNGNSICFMDTNRGFLGGDSLYRTDDGGKTWMPMLIDSIPEGSEISDIAFFNQQTGYFIAWYWDGSVLFSTHDGGKNWKKQQPRFAYHFTNIALPDSNRIALCGYNSKGSGYFAITENQGLTWTFQSSKSPSVYDINFIDGFYGFAVSWNYYNISHNDSGIVMCTNDGGNTWETVYGYPGRVNSVCITPSKQTGYILGSNNLLLRFQTTTSSKIGNAIVNVHYKKRQSNELFILVNYRSIPGIKNSSAKCVNIFGQYFRDNRQLPSGVYFQK